MRSILRISLLLLAVLCASDVFCQKNKKKKKDTRKSETKEVQVFGEENEDYFNDDKRTTEFNLLKINPLIAIGGDFPIFYERILNRKFAVELHAGPTLRPTFAWVFNDIFGENSTVEDDYSYLNPKLGFLGGIEMKYYASRRDDAPDGFYMGAGFRYKKYNADSYGFDEYGIRQESGEIYKTPFTAIDFVRVTAGMGNVSDNVFTEWYIGFALRQKKYTQTFPVVDQNTGLVFTDFETTKRMVPAFLLGFKIGFSF